MEVQRVPPEIIVSYDEALPTSSERICSFFEEIYGNYNRIWQEIIKVPSINGDYVPCESFIKVLLASNITIQDPYCLFLLDTCATKLQQSGSS